MKLLDSKQAAEYLGLSRQRIQQLCAAGHFGEKVGSRWVIRLVELEAFAELERPAGRPPAEGEVGE